MDQIVNTFHVSPTVFSRPKPTIVIPSLPTISLTGTLTPPTTPPLTPITPSSPTPTAEFPSRTIRSPNTPKAWNSSCSLFGARLIPEIVETTASSESKDDPGLLTPPLTPPSVQLTALPHCVCPVEGCVSRSFGICIGAPTVMNVKDRLPESSQYSSLTGKKRKREAQKQRSPSTHDSDSESLSHGHHIVPSHPPRIAPCNDCLDDDESLLWGRCDNKRCWSRRYEYQKPSSSSKRKGKNAAKKSGTIADTTTTSDVDALSPTSPKEIALICPDCSPEGGLGCEHRWICDSCAFSSPNDSDEGAPLPLVWECPGCFTPLCAKCPIVSPSCSCPSSRAQSKSVRNPYCIDCMPPSSCVLCAELLPICLSTPPSPAPLSGDPFSSSPGAESTYTYDAMGAACGSSMSCANCFSSLCLGCRSVLKCSMEGCNAELCQLCPLPDDGLGLDVGEVVCRECEAGLQRRLDSMESLGSVGSLTPWLRV